jgi:putative acetyltransferase
VSEGAITPDDPRNADVRALLQRHLEFAKEHSPPEDVHALDIDGLLDPSISFFAYRVAGELLGIGALKHLDDGHAELKSMHTAAEARGRGVGRALLEHLLDLARQRGYRRVSLETGTMDAFAPARAMYANAGFVSCPPFSGYWASQNSVCMTLVLAQEAP